MTNINFATGGTTKNSILVALDWRDYNHVIEQSQRYIQNLFERHKVNCSKLLNRRLNRVDRIC